MTEAERHDGAHWSPEEDEVVLNDDLTSQEKAKLLGRTYYAIHSRRVHLLNPTLDEYRRARWVAKNVESQASAIRSWAAWSEEEDRILRDTLDQPIMVVAARLGRSMMAVAARRYRYRLGITPNSASARRAREVLDRAANRSEDFGPACHSCGLNHRGECP